MAMDMTELARELLEPVAAHRTVGIKVVRAADGEARIEAQVQSTLTNVIGAMSSVGLIALIDVAGLGAIVAACPEPAAMVGVVPLGRSASLEFLAPARGTVTATAALDAQSRAALAPLWTKLADRARLSTEAEITDQTGNVVCRGRFDWSVRRITDG